MTSRSESVIVMLRDMILGGQFPTGFHLQEIPLARLMGVSRTPIREALATLSHEGLVEPGPKRGYKVRTFTIDEIMDAYEVRANLEGLAARLLAEKGVMPDIADRLERALADGDRMLERGLQAHDQAEWLEMNNAFHLILVTATGNAMLAAFVAQSHRVPLASARHVHWYKFDRENFDLARRAHEAHHEVYEAVAKGQGVRAESLMREHIYFSQRLINRHVTGRLVGFDAPAPVPA